MPLVEYPGLFDTELDLFMSETHPYRWSNRSIGQTAVPMQRAWRAYKAGDAKKAISILVDDMAPVDWQLACIAWVTRHAEKGNAP